SRFGLIPASPAPVRWTPGGESGDLEDRRGSSGFRFGGAPIGIGGAVILLVLSLLFGRNFFSLLGTGDNTGDRPAVERPVDETPAEHREVQFVSFVLDDAQSTWNTILSEQARVPYRHAKLVLFRDAIGSACGFADAASGAVYGPDDEKVHLDIALFDVLRSGVSSNRILVAAYLCT